MFVFRVDPFIADDPAQVFRDREHGFLRT